MEGGGERSEGLERREVKVKRSLVMAEEEVKVRPWMVACAWMHWRCFRDLHCFKRRSIACLDSHNGAGTICHYSLLVVF